MKIINNIQGLRGIAVLLVLFVHVGLVEKKYSLHPILPDWIQFGMSGVDIFFVISGFIMMSITMTKRKDIENAFTFLYSRVVRIYPIYWFYTTLILIVAFMYPEWVNSSSSVESNILKSFLLLPQTTAPLLQVGWTLIHEMYFYVGFFIVLLFLRSNKAIVFSVLVWGVTIVVLDTLFEFTNPIYKIVVHPLTLEFIGGVFIAYIVPKESSKLSVLTWKIIFIISLLFLLINYLQFQDTYTVDPFGWWRVLWFGLPALLLMYASLVLEKRGKILPTWINSIGDRSYTIYLAHILVLNAVGKVWQLFAFESTVMSVLFIVVLIASTLIYGKYAYTFVEVPMLNKLRKFRKKI